MSTIGQQTVRRAAPPSELYAMYLDPAAHAEFTGGGPATITPLAGSEWSAFGGRIYGRVLALTPDQQIVQSWRSFEWHDDDPDSVLVLAFTAEGAGTRLELVQIGVPERLYDTLVSGWPSRYWDPWRAFLASRSDATPARR
jgi:activator of HSP90 ATPase